MCDYCFNKLSTVNLDFQLLIYIYICIKKFKELNKTDSASYRIVVTQFLPHEQTCLVRCAADSFTGRPLCVGCDTKYMKFYENEQGKSFDHPIMYPGFDGIVSEFNHFLANVVDYCKSKKVPIRLSRNNTNIISLRPVYKLLVAAILIGVFLLYLSN